MDIVFIRGLSIDTVLGVHDWEKTHRRIVVLDLDLGCDTKPAAASDRIEDALDYSRISRRLQKEIQSHQFDLIETLAEHCATILRKEFSIPWLRMRVHKPGALGEGVDVGVEIERGSR